MKKINYFESHFPLPEEKISIPMKKTFNSLKELNPQPIPQKSQPHVKF